MGPAVPFTPCCFAYNFLFPLPLCPYSACPREILLLFFKKDPALSCLISSRCIEVKSTISTLTGGAGIISPFQSWESQGPERGKQPVKVTVKVPGSNYQSVPGWHIILEQYVDWASLGYLRGGSLLPPIASPWPVLLFYPCPVGRFPLSPVRLLPGLSGT